MFWGAVVKTGEPVKLFDVAETDILKLCTAVLGTQEKTGKTTLIAEVEGKKHVLAHLVADRTEQVSFDLYFKVDQDVTFSVQGKGEVHLGGYFEPSGFDEDEDDEEDDEDEVDDFRALKGKGGDSDEDDEDSEEDKKPVGKKPEPKGQLFGQNPPKQAQQQAAKQQSPKLAAANPKQQSPKLAAANPTQGKPQQQQQNQKNQQQQKKPAGKGLEDIEDDDDEDDFEDLDDDDDDDDDLDGLDDDDDDDDDDEEPAGKKPKGGPGAQPQKKVKGPGGNAIPNVNQAMKQQQGGKPQQQGGKPQQQQGGKPQQQQGGKPQQQGGKPQGGQGGQGGQKGGKPQQNQGKPKVGK
mmetsp:Transcript_27708/g.31952  ORF Transcript_27708/g.31952 Transcript_27708/m.31952 type:complete len:350 (-) Transcript_27708:156-1205(-)|eukprot:CAMPEP_0176422050 /NCGR_PEP_ID=MMETSP0127-20121128/9520_1 /TAXON_ID=938130 /ORGANISM="Platyophrya macrostoma, Strain WH" /LENGTH=349 /DNA_ID=CAMNT_0017802861 /DNA_START=19 /DNA_END=1068 /DNA_ORIENTATION=+